MEVLLWDLFFTLGFSYELNQNLNLTFFFTGNMPLHCRCWVLSHPSLRNIATGTYEINIPLDIQIFYNEMLQ